MPLSLSNIGAAKRSRRGFSFIKTLDNPNSIGTSADDQFGTSVAVNNRYAIVGAPGEDTASATNSGRAYIFSLPNGSLVYNLVNPNSIGTPDNDVFGSRVAISDNYAIVSAPYEDVPAGGSASGRAYIYSLSTGQLVYNLNNPNSFGTSTDDIFGYSVDISNNYAIVGAPGEDATSQTNAGKAYIYSLSTGSLLYTLNNPSTTGSDQFGESVAINENYAIVGSVYESDSGTNSGKAYIYSLSNGSLLYTLDNPNSFDVTTNDFFGHFVDISNNYAIVGAFGERQGLGAAYVFSLSTGSLVCTLVNPNVGPDDTNFGGALGITDDYAVVGAAYTNINTVEAVGAAYIFSIPDGVLQKIIANPNAYTGDIAFDTFGYSVGISNNFVIVAAPGEDDAGGLESGKSYVWSLIKP